MWRRFYRSIWRLVEAAMLVLIWPLNQVFAVLFRNRVRPRSVLHICYPVHVVHYTVVLLRQHGFDAAYMALGDSEDWTECDYRFRRYAKWMPLTLTEFWWFWRVVSRYQTLYLHYMKGISEAGWEWPILKRMGRRIVVYHSGCEIRDRDRNMHLHPEMNICQDCDYNALICTSPHNHLLKRLTRRYADLELITTPDMRDFVPHGLHFPFFSPLEDVIPPRTRSYWPENKSFRIVHVTNHPGIEGTKHIEAAVEALKNKGYPVEFQFLRRVPYDQVLAAFAEADLAIGKMKMGYYANAQIEAMCCGTPTVTHVREELMTDALRDSALIFSSLDRLEGTIEHFITQPEVLAMHRERVVASARRLHDNDALAGWLIEMYEDLNRGLTHAEIAERRGGR